MRRMPGRSALICLVAGATTLLMAAAGPATAASSHLPPGAQRQIDALKPHAAHQAGKIQPLDGDGGEEDPGEIADQAAQYALERIAPATSVPPAALPAARAAAAALPASGSAWSELTTQPYNAEPAGYTDPVESNAGAGFGLVSGRMTALAVDGSYVYGGAADGGVWRSTDKGKHWTPLTDSAVTLSVGALAVTPDHALWVGTGEANTNSDAYSGQGIYRSTNHGTSFSKVGGNALDGAEVFRLLDDGVGHVYAATTRGLYRLADTGAGTWQQLLAPVADPGPYDNFVTDVAVRPGTDGKTVLAAAAWRNGAAYNGFYLSTDGGATFNEFTPKGAIDPADIGRTTFAYAPDGSALYAIVQSPTKLLAGGPSNLQGVFKVNGGNPLGTWVLIATSASLGASGSALQHLPGYHVGVQAWYNQALAIDPTDYQHVYVSLEEVFETRDGGKTFSTASPYWNFGLACGTACPQTTHPDQHALAVSGGQVWIGNDGGLYRRSTSASGYGHWTDLNSNLHTLQYYGVSEGAMARGGTAYWGGMQDNGTSVLFGANSPQMIEPAGGDGGLTLTDPSDGTNSMGEYVYLSLYLTNDGGHTFRTVAPPDSDVSLARFIAPVVADTADPTHWVAGGEHIYNDTAGWQTVCDDTTCDWAAVHDLGAGNVATALAVNGSTTYAAWVGGGGNPGPAFASGIDTNYGGTWHTVTAPNLPQRYIAGMAVDPANPAHVYAIYNGYSRRWIAGGGVGHVFESNDGGATWSDISGNLPDVGGDDMVLSHGSLVLATDVGAFVTSQAHPGTWKRFGSGLPNTAINDLSVSPNGRTIVAATHGRGLWTIPAP
jgi:hypothetical protein